MAISMCVETCWENSDDVTSGNLKVNQSKGLPRPPPPNPYSSRIIPPSVPPCLPPFFCSSSSNYPS